MKLSPQVLALLALSLSATSLAGGCAEDGGDPDNTLPDTGDPEQDLAPLTEADDEDEATPSADAGATQAPVADGGKPTKKDSKRSEPCPACGLG